MSDPRTLLANDRVAHETLRGQVAAPRYGPGHLRRVAAPLADVLRSPMPGRLQRQLLTGEPFLELDSADGFSFGRAELSGYVGYVASAALGDWREPTHRVAVRATLAFDHPDIKTPQPVTLGLGSRVAVLRTEGRFAVTADATFLPAAHLCPLDRVETDPVAVARILLGTPYLWGGNSAFGIDCSGLVQAAMRACGHPCPGDSDQICAALGRLLPANSPWQPGDLLFWPGHVAMIATPATLLHSNAHYMAVVEEDLSGALVRMGAPAAHKRLA